MAAANTFGEEFAPEVKEDGKIPSSAGVFSHRKQLAEDVSARKSFVEKEDEDEEVNLELSESESDEDSDDGNASPKKKKRVTEPKKRRHEKVEKYEDTMIAQLIKSQKEVLRLTTKVGKLQGKLDKEETLRRYDVLALSTEQVKVAESAAKLKASQEKLKKTQKHLISAGSVILLYGVWTAYCAVQYVSSYF